MTAATTVVTELRVNYTPMRFYEDGRESPYYNSIIPLDPRVNLRFTLSYVHPDVFLDVLTTTLGLGEPLAYELRNFWRYRRVWVWIRVVYEFVRGSMVLQ